MTRRLLSFAPVVVLALMLVPLRTNAQPVTIDGVFFDWQPTYQIDTGEWEELLYSEGDPDTPDPEDPSYRIDVDIEDVYAVKGEDSLYIRVDYNDAANLLAALEDTSYHGGAQSLVYFDVDNDSATGLTWGWWENGYDAYVQIFPASEDNHYAVYEHTQEGTGWSWVASEDTTAAHAVWNSGYNNVEIAVPLRFFSDPTFLEAGVGDTLKIIIEASELEGPWRADMAPSLGAGIGMPFLYGAGSTAIGETPQVSAFRLMGNHPNPFSAATKVAFELGRPSAVALRVYDALGREVKAVSERTFGAGAHAITVSAAGLANGLYIYRLDTNEGSKTGTMLLLK